MTLLYQPPHQQLEAEGENIMSVSSSEPATFIRRRSGRYVPAKQLKLRNSLLAGVGFLELANAGDFAANVWNIVPVPTFVTVLMAIGATVALSISYFAIKDATLSWRNLSLLRKERACLRTERARYRHDSQILRYLDARLDLNFREIGTECVDRIGMDILMGICSVLVGVGTFMAIGGANPVVFRVSNLMSGYIGNAPPALYGIFNATWSLYVYYRAQKHGVAGEKELKMDNGVFECLLKQRIHTVQMHATLNCVTGIIAGIASLITATRWWGYVVLIPCIASSIYCNYIWRCKIGYDRPLGIQRTLSIDKNALIEELKFTTFARRTLKETPPSKSLQKLAPDSSCISSIIDFFEKYDLFEDLCTRVLQDTDLSTAIFSDPLANILAIDSYSLRTLDETYFPRLLKIAETCVGEVGQVHFRYRQRYLLEIMGSYLITPEIETTAEKTSDSV